MAALPFQYITLVTNAILILFVGYYFLKVRGKEKKLEEKEKNADTQFHHIVDETLAQERKIIDDATAEADQIVAGAKQITNDSQASLSQALSKMVGDIEKEAGDTTHAFEATNQSSKTAIEQAVATLLAEFQKEATATKQELMTSYRSSLKQVAITSLTDFQTITKELSVDLQKTIKEFHDSLLPAMEKELEEYKKARMNQAEQTITRVVQKASQEILHTSVTLSDHQNLVLEALEQAKKEGVFD